VVPSEPENEQEPQEKRADAVLILRVFSAGLAFLDRDNPLGTVRAEAGKHCVDVGVHLEKWLDHLADSRRARVLWQNLRPLLHSFHLITHNRQNGALS